MKETKLAEIDELLKAIRKQPPEGGWRFDTYKEEEIDDTEFGGRKYIHRWVGECDYIGPITVVDVEGHGDYAGYIQALDPTTVSSLVKTARAHADLVERVKKLLNYGHLDPYSIDAKEICPEAYDGN